MSRSNNGLTDDQDAFGYLLSGYQNGLELEEILVGTSWTIERYIDSNKPTYVAILKKRVTS